MISMASVKWRPGILPRDSRPKAIKSEYETDPISDCRVGNC